MVDVGDHDLGEVDLEQIDLLTQDQRQQQVERPREHVEVELEVDQTHARNVSGATGPAADAHRPAHVRERVGGDRAGLLGALGQRLLEPRRVGPELPVALADRRQVLDHGVGHGLS